MSDTEGDSDAPEECTLEQGFLQDQKISKIQKESKVRATLEGKQLRRRWALNRAPLPSKLAAEDLKSQSTTAADHEGEDDVVNGVGGMLPTHIVELLAANEKKVFLSDSEGEIEVVKEKPLRKKQKPEAHGGSGAVIVKDIPPPPCLDKSLEFLRKRKMEVQRSFTVLDNSKQALKMLSGSGLLRN